MTREALLMDSNKGAEELEEVTQELLEKEMKNTDLSLETGLLDEIVKKPTQTPIQKITSGAENVLMCFFTPIFIQSFIMTFLGEWGDRSQIATVALAGSNVRTKINGILIK